MEERKRGVIPPALQGIVDEIEKRSGQSIYVGDMPDIKFIPFSSPQLNWQTRGGIPIGHSTEIVGEESSGKSTLAQDVIKNYQEYETNRVKTERKILKDRIEKETRKAAKRDLETQLEEMVERFTLYVDIERTLNPTWLEKLGVDANKVMIYKPNDVGAEIPLDNTIKYMETGSIGLVIVDSIGQMISTTAADSSVGKGEYGGISKVLGKYYGKASPVYSKHNIAHIVINQTRADMSGYNQLNRPGGKANQFAQSLVLRLRPGKGKTRNYEDTTNASAEIYAKPTIVQAIKNKTKGADRQIAQFTIKPFRGLDIAFDTLNQGMEDGFIVKGGAWYEIFDPRTGESVAKFQGQSKVVEYLEENEDFVKVLHKAMYELAIKPEEDE